jgi:NADPH-dependent 2,4-dienoyl-CoA reductase/sulfur reductase-like enzyme/peroxiredoxin family protein/rhodanese-related sulfurtransferase/TusA-related sulfurtransferase
MEKKVVIIGGVAGGATCAARLRRLDKDVRIIILERGPYISYANCGLPYYTGGVISSRSSLLLQRPETMKARFDIDVRVKNEVTSIDRKRKTVTVRDLEKGRSYDETYDILLIATGSSPLRPGIPGINSPRIRTVWDVPDADAIRAEIVKKRTRSAAVVGGGFIGLEMAENLLHAGLKVSIIEAADQVMAPLDPEMAALLHENLRQNGIGLILGDGVASFQEDENQVVVATQNGKSIAADMVILAIGVRPNSALAKDAGLPLNHRGGIVVDRHMRTEDPSIYAVGDAVEVTDPIFGGRTMVPLAGPANKEGRIAADCIAAQLAASDSTETGTGTSASSEKRSAPENSAWDSYRGTIGTSVAKVCDLTAASTGANEKSLKKHGLVRGKDYERVIIVQKSHAAYYPGALPMTLKLIFSCDGSRIFGAQIVGREGVDKRIDVLSTAMQCGAGVNDLKNLELAYAPPYSSAKDPVNMAGFMAENVLRGLAVFSDWDLKQEPFDAVLLDVREDAERAAYELPGTVNIPLGQLREHLSELDHEREIIVLCAVGVRAYNAARILMQNGFRNVKIYPGGISFYRSLFPQTESGQPHQYGENTAGKNQTSAELSAVSTKLLDCTGLQCPGPLMKVAEAVKEMEDGGILEVVASDPGFSRDIVSWCRHTGNALLSTGKQGTSYTAKLRKGTDTADSVSAGRKGTMALTAPQGKTIVVFSNDLDKVFAAFVIANGALAMGRPVTMFFTFWGLTALLKQNKPRVRKSFMEKMFSMMLPKSVSDLSLSKMNMGGMGTAMMKKIMKNKNIDSPEAMMKNAMKQGVRIIACSMSMDVMGIRKEELIGGVEVGGVGTYLGYAEESGMNLFI